MYADALENPKPLFRARFMGDWLTVCEVPFRMWRKGDVYYIRTHPDEYRKGTLYKYVGKQTYYKRADYYRENWKLVQE